MVTADSIATEMLDYAEALATRQQCAVVEIPIVRNGSASTANLLIGHGIPLASVPRSTDEDPQASWTLDSRDEFGSADADIDAAATIIDELVARRAAHALSDAAGVLRATGSGEQSDAGASEHGDVRAHAEHGETDRNAYRGTVTSIAEGAAPRRSRSDGADHGDDRR